MKTGEAWRPSGKSDALLEIEEQQENKNSCLCVRLRRVQVLSIVSSLVAN